jgi:hypothetical protein
MMDEQMFAIVSEQEKGYEFVFGQEKAINRGEEMDEMYPDEDFTLYLIGQPVLDLPEFRTTTEVL